MNIPGESIYFRRNLIRQERKNMLLAFDVGNTNIVCGIYHDRELIGHWRFATDTLQTADGYAGMMANLFRLNGMSFSDIEDVIISTGIFITLSVYFSHLASQVYHAIKKDFCQAKKKRNHTLLFI